MGFWDNVPEDEFKKQLEHLMNLRKQIAHPLSEVEVVEIIEEWKNLGGGFIVLEVEEFHLGADEDDYIVLANATPNENNPQHAHFFILRDDDYKRKGKFKYKIDFVSVFDEEDDVDEEAFVDTICQTNNLLSAINLMRLYWKSYLNQQ